jgi:hypothetical protein
LNANEKSILRILFQNKIYRSDGQAFEDLFTSIMNYAEKDFRQIKPWGNIGDRKCDGYIKSKGIFFQVYAPEDIKQNYPSVISKLKTDFAGLKKHWENDEGSIREFYFVVNDKYDGVNPDSEMAINEIVSQNSLDNGGFKTAKDIENLLFDLNDDQILTITGAIPDPSKLKGIDYSVLSEVVGYIMRLPIPKGVPPVNEFPDWEEKIKFNNLTEVTTKALNSASIQICDLEKYLENDGDFLADQLRDKLSEIYENVKQHYSGDELFWKIVSKVSPTDNRACMTASIVVMSKYFESCDIFEKPE